MSRGDPVADYDAILIAHAVQDRAILDAGILSDLDGVNVSADDGVHPDAGVFANGDVADDLRGVVEVAAGGNLGGDAFVGTEHGVPNIKEGKEESSLGFQVSRFE